MLFTFNKGDVVGSDEGSSIISINLDCVAFIEETDPSRGFPSRWFVSRGSAGWFVTKAARAQFRG
jgi:hypothetical protein